MERKRLLLPGFVSPELCKELVFIQKSCGALGYRPHVLSTTLPHLVATNSAALIMPFIALRERVKEAVEEFFGCEYELFVELTSLISWTAGATIGWHSDDNRDYLRQRHFSAVCYLNTYEQDFRGGLFRFQDGQPATVIPTLGTVLIYSANEANIHCVDEVMDGERITLALWFTRDSAHDEDKKLINQLMKVMPLVCNEQDEPSGYQRQNLCGENAVLSRALCKQEKEGSEEKAERDLVTTKLQSRSVPRDAILRDYFVPVPASTNMYWVSEIKSESEAGHEAGCEVASESISLNTSQQGFDVRMKRLASLGFHIVGQLDDAVSILDKPLKLNYHDQQIAYEFANILHALQVLHFHEGRTCAPALCSSSVCFSSHPTVRDPKSHEPPTFRTSLIREPGQPQPERRLLHADINAAVVKPWEDYMRTLCADLLQMLPEWQNTRSIFLR